MHWLSIRTYSILKTQSHEHKDIVTFLLKSRGGVIFLKIRLVFRGWKITFLHFFFFKGSYLLIIWLTFVQYGLHVFTETHLQLRFHCYPPVYHLYILHWIFQYITGEKSFECKTNLIFFYKMITAGVNNFNM